jgi:hypothetical protein
MGASEGSRAKYFDTCRRKRNNVDYDSAGIISTVEVEELIERPRPSVKMFWSGSGRAIRNSSTRVIEYLSTHGDD